MAQQHRGLLPLAYDHSRPPGQLAISTVREGQKRDFSTSDMYSTEDEFGDIPLVSESGGRSVYKRIHRYSSSDAAEWSLQQPASSPPLRPAPGLGNRGNDDDVDDDDDEGQDDGPCEWENKIKAQNIIQNAIENGQQDIRLSDLQLAMVPDEVQDLKWLVSLRGGEGHALTPKLRLYLFGNEITDLPYFLFDLADLTVLSLRKNLLKEIPSGIGRLKNLIELSVACNQLEYLPSQILELPKLRTLTLYPNAMKPLPEEVFDFLFPDDSILGENGVVSPPASSGSVVRKLIYRSLDTEYFADNKLAAASRSTSKNGSRCQSFTRTFSRSSSKRQGSFVRTVSASSTNWDMPYANKPAIVASPAKLSEMCLRIIGGYRASTKEDKEWNLEPHLKLRVERARNMVRQRNMCGVCHRSPIVEPLGFVYEWWDGVCGNDRVTIQRVFCSGACLARLRAGKEDEGSE